MVAALAKAWEASGNLCGKRLQPFLVAHCGETTAGEYLHTLCMIDIATCWAELRALPNRGQTATFVAIQDARSDGLPFPLLGIDSDNGGEFINDQLYRYCLEEQITFTRGRSGNKNDNAHVEQKNWSVVRRAVGYYRYDTPSQLDLLNRLYAVMHLYVNFFLPVAKLLEKSRQGSKVIRRYDEPRTPYARVLASPHVLEEHKAVLRETYELLDLVYLRQQIDRLQDQLLDSVSRPSTSYLALAR